MGGGKTPNSCQQSLNTPINLTKSEDNIPSAVATSEVSWQPVAGGSSAASPVSSPPVNISSKHGGVASPAISRAAPVAVHAPSTIALITPLTSRPAAHVQSGPTAYHVTRASGGTAVSARVVGAQAVRVAPLTISGIVNPATHQASYPLGGRVVSASGHPPPPLLRPTSAVAVAAGGGRTRPGPAASARGAATAATGAARSVSAGSAGVGGARSASAGPGVVGGTAGTVYCSPPTPLTATAAPAATTGGARAQHAAPATRAVTISGGSPAPAAAPPRAAHSLLTYSMIQPLRGTVQSVGGCSSAGDRGEAPPAVAGKTGSGARTLPTQHTAAPAHLSHQITMTVPWNPTTSKVMPQASVSQFVPVAPAPPSSRPVAAQPATAAAAAIPVAKVLPQQQVFHALPSSGQPRQLGSDGSSAQPRALTPARDPTLSQPRPSASMVPQGRDPTLSQPRPPTPTIPPGRDPTMSQPRPLAPIVPPGRDPVLSQPRPPAPMVPQGRDPTLSQPRPPAPMVPQGRDPTLSQARPSAPMGRDPILSQPRASVPMVPPGRDPTLSQPRASVSIGRDPTLSQPRASVPMGRDPTLPQPRPPGPTIPSVRDPTLSQPRPPTPSVPSGRESSLLTGSSTSRPPPGAPPPSRASGVSAPGRELHLSANSRLAASPLQGRHPAGSAASAGSPRAQPVTVRSAQAATGELQRLPHGSAYVLMAEGRHTTGYGIPASVVYQPVSYTYTHTRPTLSGGSVAARQPAPESRGGGGGGGAPQPILSSSQASRMTSPRPSILRKRDHSDWSPARAARNLSRQLGAAGGPRPPLSVTSVAGGGAEVTGSAAGCVSPPRRPPSSGHSSSTISASSSPGEPATTPVAAEPPQTPVVALSPRKKPRKQNLVPTPAAAAPAPLADLCDRQPTAQPVAAVQPPAAALQPQQPQQQQQQQAQPAAKWQTMSLLNSYGGVRTWRSASSHFVRYTDVRARDERRPTIADLASQRHILQKINGWKLHHVSGQMDELADVERTVHHRLTDLLRTSERMSFTRREDKEISKLNELIKGNVQRSKILRDQITEAKVQVSSVFEHKLNIQQAIDRYGRKRPLRKRDRR